MGKLPGKLFLNLTKIRQFEAQQNSRIFYPHNKNLFKTNDSKVNKINLNAEQQTVSDNTINSTILTD